MSRPTSRPLVIGIAGGVGSGKSTVAGLLESLGARILDADRIARACLEEPDVVSAVSASFGPSVLGDDGTLDRAAIGRVVFGDGGDDAREALEAIVHPRVRTRLRERLDAIGAEPTATRPPVVVLDVPLLLEGPTASWCDRVVFIATSDTTRRDRTVGDRGWDPSEVARREAAQMALDEKRGHADHVLTNDGTLEDLERAVRGLWDELLDLSPHPTDRMEGAEAPPEPPRGDD